MKLCCDFGEIYFCHLNSKGATCVNMGTCAYGRKKNMGDLSIVSDLTHLPLDKMAAISQTIFPYASS